ncbi:MAG: HAD-IIB family hydrolase [Candidatus Limivicinus sp.]
MGRFSNILMASDFDRTLTDFQSNIPQKNIEAIREFEAEGGLFTMATGRSVPMFRKYMDMVPTNAPLVLYNGAAIYDSVSGELLDVQEIPGGRELVRELHDRYPRLWLEIQGVDYHYLFEENPMRDKFLDFFGAAHKLITVDELPLPLIKPSFSGTFIDHTAAAFYEDINGEFQYFRETAEEMRRDYGDIMEVDLAMPRIIDLQAKNVSKGRAARKLAERLGRKILVCCGDGLNDVSMLKEADHPFVPCDCSAQLLDMGFNVTVSCNTGTIYGALNELKKIY